MRKMLPWLVSLLLAITLIVLVFIYFLNSDLFGSAKTNDPNEQAKATVANEQPQPLSADDTLKVTSELTNIQTNIADTNYVVRISFSFRLDSEKAKTEFDKIKDIEIKPIINKALWVMTQDDVKGTKGKDQLCANLINAINPYLSEGKLTNVKITDFIVTAI
jgi:flagellar FliL protein